MPRVTCRCGYTQNVEPDGPERIVCPKCSARIRVRRGANPPGDEADPDEFIRFACPCGRRLKVKAAGNPQAGKCPDCGRVVPVPTSSSSALSPAHPEATTEELSASDVAALEQWAKRHLSQGAPAAARPGPSAAKSEAGLRVCPRCGRPVHLGAVACRECGTHVPKR
jgi:DNA-directed RNA polymerase subunit M/transcription elongation factor TFIIS